MYVFTFHLMALPRQQFSDKADKTTEEQINRNT